MKRENNTVIALGKRTGIVHATLEKGSQGKYSKCHCHYRLHFCKMKKTLAMYMPLLKGQPTT
jgi:hypothetical protein